MIGSEVQGRLFDLKVSNGLNTGGLVPGFL